MVHIRRLQTEKEWQEAVTLSDATFRDVDQVSMGEAFPNVFSASLRQSFGAFVDDKLVSFMGLVPAVIRLGSSRLHVYSMGSVCTDKEHRGKGYASSILQETLSFIHNAGASLLLVSGDRSLYTRAGCAPFGSVTRFKLNPTALPHRVELPDGAVIREMLPTDWFGLYALAGGRTSRYEQSLWDLANMIGSEALASCNRQSHRVFVAELNRKLQGFVVVGVPAPQAKPAPRAYEWGGSAVWVSRLLAHAVTELNLSALHTFVPWHEKELLAALSGVPSEPVKNSGTILVVSPEALADQIRGYVQELTGSSGRFTMERSGGVIQIGWKERHANLTLSELIPILFDQGALQNVAIPLDDVLRQQLAQFLPLPFPYVAGLNYV